MTAGRASRRPAGSALAAIVAPSPARARTANRFTPKPWARMNAADPEASDSNPPGCDVAAMD
jgi:hypothetical protein